MDVDRAACTAIRCSLAPTPTPGVWAEALVVWRTQWGAVEQQPQRYDFSGYRQVLDLVKGLGLKLQAVMSFHACGGNVGDSAQVPLPKWVMKVRARPLRTPHPQRLLLLRSHRAALTAHGGLRLVGAVPCRMTGVTPFIHLALQGRADQCVSLRIPMMRKCHTLQQVVHIGPDRVAQVSAETYAQSLAGSSLAARACRVQAAPSQPGRLSVYTARPRRAQAGEQDPDLFFTDRPRDGRLGGRNREYVSLWADEAPRALGGRSPLECYGDFMVAFRDAFLDDLGSAIEEVVVGAGPCGELRYPSYVEASGWRFPGVRP